MEGLILPQLRLALAAVEIFPNNQHLSFRLCLMEHLCSFLRLHQFQRSQSLIHVNLAKKFHARSDELRSKQHEDHHKKSVVFLVHDEHPKNTILVI